MQSTAFTFGEFVWFIGLVTNVRDPSKLGRVQVSVFGYQITSEEDFDKAKDYIRRNLDSTVQREYPESYWATLVQPVTSAGFGGIGETHGLKAGSTVFGFFADGRNAQQPVIIGSMGGLTDSPIKIPNPPPPNRITRDSVGRKKISIGSEATDTHYFRESSPKPDVHRLTRNEDIDKTIVHWKKNNISRVKSAHTVSQMLRTPSGSFSLDSLMNGLSDNVANRAGLDIVRQAQSQLITQLHNALDPEKAIERAISRAKSTHPDVIRAVISEIGITKCNLVRMLNTFGSVLEEAVVNAGANALEGMIQSVLGDTLDSFLIGLEGGVQEISASVALAEAEAIGALADTVGSITNLAYDIEGVVLSPILDGINTLADAYIQGIDSLIGNIDDLDISPGGLELLRNRVQSVMNINNGVQLIKKNTSEIISDTLPVLEKTFKAITDIPEEVASEFIDSRDALLDQFKLKNLNCG